MMSTPVQCTKSRQKGIQTVLSPRNRWIRSITFAAMLFTAVANAQVQPLMVPENEDTLSGADVEFQTDLKKLNINVSPQSGQSGGCSSGQNWDINQGQCVSALKLRTETTTRSCSCSCSSGQTGSCTSRQTGTYSVMGWRIPPSGVELISHNTATSWGSCQRVSSTCKDAPTSPPPSGGGGGGGSSTPTVGAKYTVDAWVCGTSSSYFWEPANSSQITSSHRRTLIDAYKQFNYYDRCPEYGGYSYWVGEWLAVAKAAQSRNGGTLAASIDAVWSWLPDGIMARMLDGAKGAGENKSSIINSMNKECQNAADKKYGKGKTVAEYDKTSSGSGCKVTKVN